MATRVLLAEGEGVTAVGGGKEVVHAHGNTGATETIDLALGNVHSVTLDANVTFTFSGATNGTACSFSLLVTQDGAGARTITWPGSVDWPGGAAPTFNSGAGKVSLWTFLSVDGGTTWYGFLSGDDLR